MGDDRGLPDLIPEVLNGNSHVASQSHRGPHLWSSRVEHFHDGGIVLDHIILLISASPQRRQDVTFRLKCG